MDWSAITWEFPITELSEFFNQFAQTLMPIFIVVGGALLGLVILDYLLGSFSDVVLKLMGRDPSISRQMARTRQQVEDDDS